MDETGSHSLPDTRPWTAAASPAIASLPPGYASDRPFDENPGVPRGSRGKQGWGR
jgi:hypothetical protein